MIMVVVDETGRIVVTIIYHSLFLLMLKLKVIIVVDIG